MTASPLVPGSGPALEGLTIDRLAYWAHQFGFGRPTGIELPGEASGIVPDREWKQRTKGEIYNLIAGQTELSRKQVVSVFDALSGVLAADLGRRIDQPVGHRE